MYKRQVFQVSRFAARALDQGKRVTALVDFMPSWDDSEAFDLLKKRASLLGHKTAEELFTGLLNKKLALVFIKLAGIKPSQKAGDLSPKQLKLLLGPVSYTHLDVYKRQLLGRAGAVSAAL